MAARHGSLAGVERDLGDRMQLWNQLAYDTNVASGHVMMIVMTMLNTDMAYAH